MLSTQECGSPLCVCVCVCVCIVGLRLRDHAALGLCQVPGGRGAGRGAAGGSVSGGRAGTVLSAGSVLQCSHNTGKHSTLVRNTISNTDPHRHTHTHTHPCVYVCMYSPQRKHLVQ